MSYMKILLNVIILKIIITIIMAVSIIAIVIHFHQLINFVLNNINTVTNNYKDKDWYINKTVRIKVIAMVILI